MAVQPLPRDLPEVLNWIAGHSATSDAYWGQQHNLNKELAETLEKIIGDLQRGSTNFALQKQAQEQILTSLKSALDKAEKLKDEQQRFGSRVEALESFKRSYEKLVDTKRSEYWQLKIALVAAVLGIFGWIGQLIYKALTSQ